MKSGNGHFPTIPLQNCPFIKPKQNIHVIPITPPTLIFYTLP